MAENSNRDNSRPPLKVRRVNLDTGRENVVVISRHSSALRPDIFRGFSRVELQRGSKVLLATLLITDDDALVGSDEIGLSEPAFRRFAEPVGSLVTVSPAAPPESLDAVRGKIQGRTFEPAEIDAIIKRPHALPLFGHGGRGVPDQFGELHDQPRAARLGSCDGRRRDATEMAKPHRRRQALHRRHSGKPHLHDRRPDRRGAWPHHPQDVLARDHLAGRDRRHHGSAGPGRCLRRRDEGSRRRMPRLPGLGRARQPVAGGRYSHLRRAPALPRHQRADGCLDHVEEARGRLDPSPDRPAGRPDGKARQRHRSDAAAQAVRVRRRPVRHRRRGDHDRRPPADRQRHRSGAGGRATSWPF